MNSTPAQLKQRQKNVKLMAKLKTSRTHCREGHKLSGKNLMIEKRKDRTVRRCRTCVNQKRRELEAFLLGCLLVNPDDKRHGTNYGYNLGCHCKHCRWARHLHRQAKKEARGSLIS